MTRDIGTKESWDRLRNVILPQRSSERAKDPFSSRRKPIWETVNQLDSLENVGDEGFAISQVYTACRIYGQSMASLDFATYEKKGGNHVEYEDHWLTKLFMENVNTYMNPADWFVTMMFHWGIAGNGMSYIARDRSGRPRELVLLDPHDLHKAELFEGEKIFHYGANQIIKDKDMFHIAGPGWDGILGKNPIEAHRDVMSTSTYMNRYIRKFYENGAHLKYVLETDEILDDEEHANLKASWYDLYSGPDKAGGTAILENGLKIKPLSLSPMDAAYLGISGNATKLIANIYGLPLYLFNEYGEGAQYENVESQDLALIKYAIGPMTVKWEQEIKRKLLPPGSKDFGRFDLFSLSRGDMKSIADYTSRFFTIGALNQDEIRKKHLNMNPLPDGQGERYYVQGNNMVPIEKIDEIYDQKLNPIQDPAGGRPPAESTDTDMPTIKED